jgi:hypothetical protein
MAVCARLWTPGHITRAGACDERLVRGFGVARYFPEVPGRASPVSFRQSGAFAMSGPGCGALYDGGRQGPN